MTLNTTICADCLQGMKELPDKSVDLVVTDPPYIIETRGRGLYTRPDMQYVKELNGIKDGFQPEVLDELCRVMKKINAYFFCSQKQIMPLLDYFVTCRKCNYNLLSWHKSNPIPACGNKYLTDTEFILFFREKGVKVFGTFDTKRTYYVTPLNQKDKKEFGHPAVKPLSIVKNLITNSCPAGGIVLDPFMGSGTTAVAAAELGFDFLGFESDPKYARLANNRVALA